MSKTHTTVPTPYQRFETAALALCRDDGADERTAKILFDAYSKHFESEEGPWDLGPDAYEELLESWRVGHRQLKAWIAEKKVGESVTATARGTALFTRIGALLS